jgi:hypothetical protein
MRKTSPLAQTEREAWTGLVSWAHAKGLASLLTQPIAAPLAEEDPECLLEDPRAPLFALFRAMPRATIGELLEGSSPEAVAVRRRLVRNEYLRSEVEDLLRDYLFSWNALSDQLREIPGPPSPSSSSMPLRRWA